MTARATLAEEGFPAQAVSRLARAGRGKPSPVYGAHKWWARRPPESVRALLIAASLSADQGQEVLWEAYGDPDSKLMATSRVADPFTGGGTSLVEAQKLGAAVYGVDVDPLAVFITQHELQPLDISEFDAAAAALVQYLTSVLSSYYPSVDADEKPLHYFFLRRVTCPDCEQVGLLYKSLVLARDMGKPGAVVRAAPMTVFCPDCMGLHHLPTDRVVLRCCGRARRLTTGTYAAGRYKCSCGKRSSNEHLRPGSSPRVLVAVEVTDSGGGLRRIREPTAAERSQEADDRRNLDGQSSSLVLPRTAFTGTLKSSKPSIYGFTSVESLFSPRQSLFFGTAFRWLCDQGFSVRLQHALALALSNALGSNNLLCGYATDYGRLSPLFTIRDYSLPALAVELNPLHPVSGRGTLRAMLSRVRASKSPAPVAGYRDSAVHVSDATRASWPDLGLDIIMTDPPYFDYIAYSDLSFLYRTWLEAAGLSEGTLTGRPLFEDGESLPEFARGLGVSLARAADRLTDHGLVIFTYHATTASGWRALTEALSIAGLHITSAFPLWADAKSPGHGHKGNIEYDIVLCCRRTPSNLPVVLTLESWMALYPDESISVADQAAWRLACDVLNDLWWKAETH